ncbi:MAG: transposase [Ferruginibacter sp.]
MSVKYKTGDDAIAHFITFATVDWVDVFTRNVYRDIIVDSLRYCILNKGMRLHAWIIMSNHVHFIQSAASGFTIMESLRDMKKFTSRQIIKSISENSMESRKEWMLYRFARAGKYNSNNKDFQFWQQDNHPIELFTPGMLKQKMDYLHENPVRAGLVRSPEEYVYSSGTDYYSNRKGLVNIEHLST